MGKISTAYPLIIPSDHPPRARNSLDLISVNFSAILFLARYFICKKQEG